jgi:transposase InsO family protein
LAQQLPGCVAASAPEQVWLADITYVPTDEGWLQTMQLRAAITLAQTRCLLGCS